MDHLQACPHCPYNDPTLAVWETNYSGCTIYDNISWVNRIGGCPSFPYRDLPYGYQYYDGVIYGPGRVGQQKQAHNDRSYSSKNDSRRKF